MNQEEGVTRAPHAATFSLQNEKLASAVYKPPASGFIRAAQRDYDTSDQDINEHIYTNETHMGRPALLLRVRICLPLGPHA